MLMTIFLIYFIFVAVIGVGISILLIRQDSEIRKLKGLLDEQSKQGQNNTKELEKFYLEKKQLQEDKDNEIAEIVAKLNDQTNISAIAVKNAEAAKFQLKQQEEGLSKLRDENSKLEEDHSRLRVEYSRTKDEHLKLKDDYSKVKDENSKLKDDLAKLKLEAHQLSEQLQQANETRLMEVNNETQKWTGLLNTKEMMIQKMSSEAASMVSVTDTMALISKEMNRRLEEHYSKMRLLDEKTQENLELIAQLEH